MRLTAHNSFAPAYAEGLRAILAEGESVPSVTDPSSVGSRFGEAERATRELRPFGFRVLDPRRCLLRSAGRQPNLAFTFGQWIWVMRGSDDVESVAFYNEKGRAFSEDGHHLSGSFGHRIRVRWGDQLQEAIALLRADPSTRRALMSIADPADVSERTRDYPCAIAFQLFVRDSRLEAITTMRSQSALMVLPYDAPLFMTIQIWVAAVLGVEPGAHTWLAHSFHMYDDELQLARAVLKSPMADEALPPVGDAEDALAELFDFEEQVRAAVGKGERGQIGLLAEKWRTRDELHSAIGNVLLANAADLLGDGMLFAEIADRLPPGLRRCMEVPRSQDTFDFIRTP